MPRPLPSLALNAQPVKRIPTAMEVFDWAVVRQSSLGPGLTTCATAFGITPTQLRSVVAQWNDPRGGLEIVKENGMFRVDAYYNCGG